MRKESTTIRQCHSRLSALGLDSAAAFHRSKLLLKIYRDVAWVLNERAEELQDYAKELGDHNLGTGLCYLENFAPDMDLQDFEEKVSEQNAGGRYQPGVAAFETVSKPGRVVL